MNIQNQKNCYECGSLNMKYQVKDVEVSVQGDTSIVKLVAGWFCSNCGEIDFDPTTDSLERWSSAGDKLVLKNRKNNE